jgi:hypothetical protein
VDVLHLGVVGFSAKRFDHAAAEALLAAAVPEMIARLSARTTVLVSGLTDCGVPGIAYRVATRMGLATVGISARQALRVRAGLFPVDRRILVGRRFGDESAAFVAMIDALIRVGGGPQSRREAAMFREKLTAQGLAPAARMIEHELAWLGA